MYFLVFASGLWEQNWFIYWDFWEQICSLSVYSNYLCVDVLKWLGWRQFYCQGLNLFHPFQLWFQSHGRVEVYSPVLVSNFPWFNVKYFLWIFFLKDSLSNWGDFPPITGPIVKKYFLNDKCTLNFMEVHSVAIEMVIRFFFLILLIKWFILIYFLMIKHP